MNNDRGWGLRNELWICLAMTIFFVIAVILINSVFNSMDSDMILSQNKKDVEQTNKKNNSDTKKEIDDNHDILEDKLVIAGRKYANKYLLSQNVGSTKIVTVVRLQTENILEPLKMNNIQCSGYIKIEKIEDDFKYYPYINCGSLYKTVGYNESLDNIDL